MRATMERLGVTASFSRPRVSNDNPFSEALFRTCKYRPDWPVRGFASLDEARNWIGGFVRWYNSENHHSAIRFVTPEARHRGQDSDILAQRVQVYEAARAANPQKWSGRTRNWQPIGSVWLNPSDQIRAAVTMGPTTRSPIKLAEEPHGRRRKTRSLKTNTGDNSFDKHRGSGRSGRWPPALPRP